MIIWMFLDIIKENGFMLKKVRSRRYPTETIINADYADIELFVNPPTQDKCLLHSLEQTAGGIGLHVNANKMEYICFKWGNISTLNGEHLKIVNTFTYLSLIGIILRWGFLIWELIFIYCRLFVLTLVVFVLFPLSLRFGQISPLAFFRWFYHDL